MQVSQTRDPYFNYSLTGQVLEEVVDAKFGVNFEKYLFQALICAATMPRETEANCFILFFLSWSTLPLSEIHTYSITVSELRGCSM